MFVAPPHTSYPNNNIIYFILHIKSKCQTLNINALASDVTRTVLRVCGCERKQKRPSECGAPFSHHVKERITLIVTDEVKECGRVLLVLGRAPQPPGQERRIHLVLIHPPVPCGGSHWVCGVVSTCFGGRCVSDSQLNNGGALEPYLLFVQSGPQTSGLWSKIYISVTSLLSLTFSLNMN